MGLDMYLFKRTKGTDDKWQEVMYWRKANQIRAWFNEALNSVENCKFHSVTKEILEGLVKDCKHVLTFPDDAYTVMPTSSGFFFGSTEYDEWYFSDLKETIEEVTKVINETNWDTEEVVYHEWW